MCVCGVGGGRTTPTERHALERFERLAQILRILALDLQGVAALALCRSRDGRHLRPEAAHQRLVRHGTAEVGLDVPARA